MDFLIILFWSFNRELLSRKQNNLHNFKYIRKQIQMGNLESKNSMLLFACQNLSISYLIVYNHNLCWIIKIQEFYIANFNHILYSKLRHVVLLAMDNKITFETSSYWEWNGKHTVIFYRNLLSCDLSSSVVLPVKRMIIWNSF